MATLVSTYQLPDGRTANTTDTRLAWRIVTDGSQTIMAEETTGQTRTLHTMIADDDPNAVAAALTAPAWTTGQALEVGDLVSDGGVVYRVDQAHTTQTDWTPTVVPALYTRIGSVGSSGPQPWVQPEGAHDAYAIGDRVTFEGATYESLIAANVWSPTAYPAGWELIP